MYQLHYTIENNVKPTNGLINAKYLFMVGASGTDTGKTTLSCALIEAFSKIFKVIALKVTTAEKAGDGCHRNGEGCGACSFTEPFVLAEELDPSSGTDTSRLLAAGAERVFWLRSLRDRLSAGYEAFAKSLPPMGLVIAESNSLREFVKPGIFVMIRNFSGPMKPSADKVADLADVLLETDSPLDGKAARELALRILGSPANGDFFRQFAPALPNGRGR